MIATVAMLVPLSAFAQAKGEKVDLEIKVISANKKKGTYEPELKAIFAELPVNYKSAVTVDGHIKPAVGVGERVRFQIAETKEWVTVTVASIDASGIGFSVELGEKGKGFKAIAKKRGGRAIAGPLAKRPDGSEILVIVRPN